VPAVPKTRARNKAQAEHALQNGLPVQRVWGARRIDRVKKIPELRAPVRRYRLVRRPKTAVLSALLAGPIVSITLVAPVVTQRPAAWQDPSPHRVRFVAVDRDVQLEVLDWGGAGRPVVLLAGGGFTAHVYDEFAPKLTAYGHVYGITRRGFGASGFSMPAQPEQRLRDDVLAVIDALHLDRVVLVGHSIAGAEMSAVASAAPDRIAGQVYLEAAYPYAFSNDAGPTMDDFQQAKGPRAPTPTASDLASFKSLQKWDAEVHGARKPEAELRQTWNSSLDGRPTKPRSFPGAQMFNAILTSGPRYAALPVPALVIFAIPHLQDSWSDKSPDPAVRQASQAYFKAIDAATEKQAKALEGGVPNTRVVRLPGAHFIFLSNQRDVLRETRAFLARLKPSSGVP
jgi:pimeloyl-ACP methyl ester carboxylesterase